MKMFSSCCDLRNNWIRLLLNDPGGWAGTRVQHMKWRFPYAGKPVNAASMEHMTEHFIYVNVSYPLTHPAVYSHFPAQIVLYSTWKRGITVYFCPSPAEQIITGNYIPNISPQVIHFFVPSRAETHTWLVSHLFLSLRHTCENLFHFHTIAALFPACLSSDVTVYCRLAQETRREFVFCFFLGGGVFF